MAYSLLFWFLSSYCIAIKPIKYMPFSRGSLTQQPSHGAVRMVATTISYGLHG